MPEAIIDGTGYGYNAGVGSDNRLWTNTVIDGTKTRGSGLVVFPKEHDREIMGQAFMCGSSFYDIPTLGSTGIMLAVGSCDLYIKADMKSDGDARLILMENVQVTNSGTQNLVINRNRCSSNTINTTIWTNPTVTTSGAVIHTAMFLGGSGTGTKFSSSVVGAGIAGDQMILCNGSCYWLKLENIAYRDISYDWNLAMHGHC